MPDESKPIERWVVVMRHTSDRGTVFLNREDAEKTAQHRNEILLIGEPERRRLFEVVRLEEAPDPRPTNHLPTEFKA